MAFKSEQARVLNRQLIGGLIRNLAVFTAALAVAFALYQVFLNPWVANAVADAFGPWQTLNSSEQFNDILADQGYLDGDEFTAAKEGWLYDVAEVGPNPTTDEIAAILVKAGFYDYFKERLYRQELVNSASRGTGEDAYDIEETPEDALADGDLAEDEKIKSAKNGSETDVSIDGWDDSLSGIYAVPNVSGGDAYATADEFAEAVAALEPDVFSIFVTWLEGTELPAQVLASMGYTMENAGPRNICAAYLFAILMEASGLEVSIPGYIVTDTTDILMTQAYYGGTQDALDATIANAYLESQNQALSDLESLTHEEQQVFLGFPTPTFDLQIQQDYTGTYHYRDVSMYNVVKSFKLPLLILLFVLGWFAIVAHTLQRSLRYFDDLSSAVASLLSDRTAVVKLPRSLSIAQNELAVIRTQSLADERAAKAAEQRKNELVAYLAHDIRTPLTSVLGYLDLLRETTDLPPSVQRKYSDIAYTKAERLGDLINEFFEITRYNLSAIPIERQTVGVRLFIEQIVESFYPDALARSVDISISTRSDDRFFVDPDKLARAVGNVMRNAMTYAEPKSTIFVSAHNVSDKTIITISNHGREISEAHLETIFEKFYREDGSRSSSSGGAGLGLAIAREIVTAHGGTIEARSEQGVTTFTIELPSGRVRRPSTSGRIPGEGQASLRQTDGEGAPQRTVRVPTRPTRRSGGASPSRALGGVLGSSRGAHQGRPSASVREGASEARRRRAEERRGNHR